MSWATGVSLLSVRECCAWGKRDAMKIVWKFGVGDGDRTRDIRCHRPTLYQLSYSHHSLNCFSLR